MILFACSSWPTATLAETPAPSVHWGALAYPDQERSLAAGLTLNRFTEFDGAGQRYNDIRETAGFNFATLSWTERWAQYPDWSTNLTVGAGPTQDGLTRFLQNDVVHKFRGLTPVPVGAKRDGTDFMISGSVTRWTSVFGRRQDGFAGIGVASGSLYHEPYAHLGVRRVSLADVAEFWGGTAPVGLHSFSRYVRFSAMGRYGQLFGGSAYPVVAPRSYLAQVSAGLGNYQSGKAVPASWEIEVAFTVDSGLFVDLRGDAIEERFVSLALRYGAATFETWNDLINQKDYGPTFGARLTFDLFRIYDWWEERP